MKRGVSTLDRLRAAVAPVKPAIDVPVDITFYAFMHDHAKVRIEKNGKPCFVRYNTNGRESLRWVIGLIDHVLGNDTSYLTDAERSVLFGVAAPGAFARLPDSVIDVCGGAQFGKTIIGLHLKVYLCAIKGMNSFYALPDDDLVEGIVDGKERPEVLDQIPWLAQMIKMGKGLNASGKAADRKGAMLFTGGPVPAMSYTRGINAKIPTTFSADCVIKDEPDDIKAANAKYLKGRMTASGLRLELSIGTQRYAGAGQNKAFEEGCKIVGLLECPHCAARHNPEEAWPKICRMDQGKDEENPWLTAEGDFVDGVGGHTAFSRTGTYIFACPDCGTELDRTRIIPSARSPERIAERKWSVRVSQMCCSGLPVIMFVSDWISAVIDPLAMKAFCCDRLAIPRSSAQAVTPEVITRSTALEPVFMTLQPAPEGRVRYAGLDTGDQCWFTCRELDPATGRKATVWAEAVAAESVRARVPALFNTLGAACLFVDAGPLRDLARDLCLMINGIPPHIDNAAELKLDGRIECGGVIWEGERKVWSGLKCAAVEFTGKPGCGITQACRITPANETVYPVIACNRDEAIEMVINELLTATEGIQTVHPVTGKLRSEPLWLLPADLPGALPVVSLLHKHILAGSCKELNANGRDQNYKDKIENHLLLASTYSRLAEAVSDSSFGRKTEAKSETASRHPDGTGVRARGCMP